MHVVVARGIRYNGPGETGLIMIRSFRKLACRRWLPVLLAASWLPYISTRCVMSPFTHTGCGVLASTASQAVPEGQHSRAHCHHRPAPAHHDDAGAKAPVRTCCDGTGKCDIKAHSATLSVDPAPVIAFIPALTLFAGPGTHQPQYGPAVTPLHGPPPYLRNATLLI